MTPGGAAPGASVFVGPYRLVGTLGEGGMGMVHLALDPAGRAVAVKVLRPHVAGDGVARRRLGREVATLRRVRHPNVAEVLDADLDAVSPYLVTAFVPARTLDHVVREHGPLPVDYVAHLGRVMAGALRSIHAAGVVHRDVKPANVLMLDDAPILIDFGIAHIADESRITSSGLVMGTPGYLPPELVEGQPITPATDWWGWGATLAYAATGRAPFGAGPAPVVLDRVRRGEADLDGVDPRLGRVLTAALTVNPVWRGTGDMLITGLAQIEPWRPGQRPLVPALRPDEVRTVPIEVTGPAGAAGGQVVAPPVAPAGPVAPAAPAAPAGQPGAERVSRPAEVPQARDLIRTTQVRTPLVPTRPLVAQQVPTPISSGPVAPAQVPVAPKGPAPPAPAQPSSAPPVASMPGEHAVAATLALALTTLAAIAAVAPGLVLVLSALWLLVARVADRTMTATLRRRYEFGPRSGDVGVAVAALPWRLLSSLPKTVFVLVIPVLLAISAAFLVAGVVAPSAPDPSTGSALAAGCVVGWFAAWWGPGGAVLRRGTRGMTRGLVRSRSAWRAVLVLFAFVLVAALLSANGGAGPDWQPVSSISRIPVPSPDLSGAVDWVLDRIFGFSL